MSSWALGTCNILSAHCGAHQAIDLVSSCEVGLTAWTSNLIREKYVKLSTWYVYHPECPLWRSPSLGLGELLRSATHLAVSDLLWNLTSQRLGKFLWTSLRTHRNRHFNSPHGGMKCTHWHVYAHIYIYMYIWSSRRSNCEYILSLEKFRAHGNHLPFPSDFMAQRCLNRTFRVTSSWTQQS
jgi:hypothetical protein